MEYDLSRIVEMVFDEPSPGQTTGIYELTNAQAQDLPDEDEDLYEFAARLAEYFSERFDESFARLEALCDISKESFIKFIRRPPRFRSSVRIIPKVTLAKFCIGAGLTPAEAKELFTLSGRALSEKSRFDYILLCELQNGSDIVEFDATLQAHGLPGVLSDENSITTDHLF